ncbi:MAG: hypothetical protein IKS48_03130 [Eubacterium sp.]|nr:hypothetical protein [Eubacterium sp.]
MENAANIGGMIFNIIIFFVGFIAMGTLAYNEYKQLYELTRCKEHVETKGIIKKFKYLNPVKRVKRYPVIEIDYLNQTLLLSDYTCIDNTKYSREGLEVVVLFNLDKFADRCYIKRKDIFSIKWFWYLLVALFFGAVSICLIYNLITGNVLDMGHAW